MTTEILLICLAIAALVGFASVLWYAWTALHELERDTASLERDTAD